MNFLKKLLDELFDIVFLIVGLAFITVPAFMTMTSIAEEYGIVLGLLSGLLVYFLCLRIGRRITDVLDNYSKR